MLLGVVLILPISTSCRTFYIAQGIDSDSIQIEMWWEEEGHEQTISEDGVYEKLGLKHEDEKEKKATKEACGTRAQSELNEQWQSQDFGMMVSSSTLNNDYWCHPW
jgi:hypothetical protein